MNGDGGVRLEMGNEDIVTTIITTDIIDGPRMAMATWTRTMSTETLNVPNVIQSTMTVMQTHLAEIQYPQDPEHTKNKDNTDRKAITGD